MSTLGRDVELVNSKTSRSGCAVIEWLMSAFTANGKSRSAVAHDRQLPRWLKIISTILEQPVIDEILTHLGQQSHAPPHPPARGQALQAA